MLIEPRMLPKYDGRRGIIVSQLYEKQEERWNSAIPFINQGLQTANRVIIITQEWNTFSRILNDNLPGVDSSITWIDPRHLSPKSDPAVDLVQVLHEKISPQQDTDYSILIDTSWLSGCTQSLPAWTGQIGAAIAPLIKNGMALCQYDQNLFSPSVTLEILKTLPMMLVDGEIIENPYFEPYEADSSDTCGRILAQRMHWLHKRRRENDALTQSEENFRALYDLAPLPYQSLNADGMILVVNQAWCELLGYPKEEAIGTWFGNYIVEAQRELFTQRFAQFKKCGEVSGVEFDLVCQDGETVTVAAVGKIIYTSNGDFKQTQCILTNISDRKHIEKVIHQSQQIYKALFENNSEVILLIDPDSGMIVTANPAATAYYGYSLDEISRLNITQINTLPRDKVNSEMGFALTLEKRAFLFQHRLANGELRDVEVFSSPIEINGEKLLYSVIHDITLQKVAEKEADRLNTAFQERLIALTQPVGDTHHLKFEDLFNLEDIQNIQDAFAEATGVASLITDVDGRPITRPSGFCRLCNDIIRKTPLGLQNCIKSDAMIGHSTGKGPFIQPCLSGGLLDAGASIMVGNHHIANWLIGQVWDTAADRGKMMKYAELIGADPAEFSAAMDEIVYMPREQFEKVCQALYLIADQLSKMAIQNVQQARTIVEREQANSKLVRVNHLYKVVSKISQTTVKAQTPEELYELACEVLVSDGKFGAAWIGLLDAEKALIYPAFFANIDQHHFEPKQFSAGIPLEKHSPVGFALREARLIFDNNIESSSDTGIWENKALEHGYHSVAAFPLMLNGAATGGLVVYAFEPNFFDAEEVHLLEKVSTTLSFALEAMEAEKLRKRAEQALLTSEERYRRLFASGNDAVFVFPIQEDGRPGNFTEVNPTVCKLLGYSQDELLQMNIWDINAPESQETVTAIYKNLLQNKHALSETAHISRDGRKIPVEINSSVFELDGKQYALSVDRDISERKLAEARIQNQLQRLSALHIIDLAINSKLPLQTLMNIILEEVVEHLQVNAADILLYNPTLKQLKFGLGKGFKNERIDAISVPLGEGIAGSIIEGQADLRIPHLLAEPRFTRKALLRGESFDSYFGAPLLSKGKILGVLEVFFDEKLEVDSEWISYFDTLAGQAAIAIDDKYMDEGLVRANQVLSQAYSETIEGWARALDLRDHETEGHSRRVTDLSLRMGRAMGLTEEELLHIHRGALLHDIGKVGVPDQILLKPGQLTAEEWAIMKRHPQYAYDLLSPISFLHPSLDIPFCHHEKWDGSGYPRGLRGEEIPLAARIFAVVDVWDALLSDRPYRKSWQQADAEKYIREQSGRHFEPRVAEVFLNMVGA